MSKAIRAKIAYSLLMAIWGYTFWSSLQGMVQAYWISGYDYQGLIILPLALTLIFSKTAELNRAGMTYSPYGLVLLLLTAILWLFAVITKLAILQQFALISMLVPIVLTTCGHRITNIIALPLISLLLLIPIGHDLYLSLQDTFSWLLLKTLSFTTAAVYWEHNTIYVGHQQYLLTDILSSLQYTTLYLAFGLTYAFFITNNFAKRIIIISCSILMPFIMLFIAVFGIITTRTWLKLGAISASNCTVISWGLSAVGLISCLVIGYALRNNSRVIKRSDNIDWRNDHNYYSTKTILPTFLASVILLLLPSVAQNLKQQAHYNNDSYASAELEKIVNWQGPVNGKYSKNSQQVSLVITNTNPNKQTIDTQDEWQNIKTSTLDIKLANKSLPITETISKKNGHTRITWGLQYVNGHITTNPTFNKVLRNLYTLSKRGSDAKLITISSNVTTDLQNSRQPLKDFLQDLQQAPSSTWLR